MAAVDAHAEATLAAVDAHAVQKYQRSEYLLTFCCFYRMFATAQKTTELWMWKMEYLHHEQRPLYFGEWF